MIEATQGCVSQKEWDPACQPIQKKLTYLFLLLIEVINNDTNEKVQGEEGSKDDEDDKVDVHVDVVFIFGLLVLLLSIKQEIKFQKL